MNYFWLGAAISLDSRILRVIINRQLCVVFILDFLNAKIS